jgi:hypothetical protein
MSLPPRPSLRHTLPVIMVVGDVARLLRLDPKTVTRHDDILQPFRTIGGHRRYRRAVVAEVAERPLASRWSQ